MGKIDKTTKILFVLIMVMLVMLILLALLSAFYFIEKGKTKYYREQMLNFCELSSSQMDLLEFKYESITDKPFPDFEPCEHWILSYDGGSS